MPNIHYHNRVFSCSEDQSVLDVLLENGQEIPFSCKMGVCVTCVMQAEAGDIPPEATEGLRQTLADKGRFLACVCKPTTDMRISNVEEQNFTHQGSLK